MRDITVRGIGRCGPNEPPATVGGRLNFLTNFLKLFELPDVKAEVPTENESPPRPVGLQAAGVTAPNAPPNPCGSSLPNARVPDPNANADGGADPKTDDGGAAASGGADPKTDDGGAGGGGGG